MKADSPKVFFQVLLSGLLVSGLLLSMILDIQLFRLSESVDSARSILKISSLDTLVLIFFLVGIFLFQRKKTGPIVCSDCCCDPLTGLIDRSSFHGLFLKSLEEARSLEYSLSVLLIDIDHLRIINERHGYETGDRVLMLVAGCIGSELARAGIRHTCCRWEGNQFLLLLADASTRDSCAAADAITTAVAGTPLHQNGGNDTISISTGIAQMNSGDSVESLMARAETGLLTARDIGRNCCAVGYDWILIEYYYEPIF